MYTDETDRINRDYGAPFTRHGIAAVVSPLHFLQDTHGPQLAARFADLVQAE